MESSFARGAREPRLFRSSPERDFREAPGAMPSPITGPGARVVDLDVAEATHKYLGMGVSFPEASCHLLMGLPEDERKAAVERVFGKTGLGLSIGRVHCGASDYSRHFYTYDDVPGDIGLEHFSIAPDRAEVIPVIKEAMAANPDLFLFSSPWSPPGWMKDGGTICGGRLLDDMIPVYADYVVKFLAAYKGEGLPIRAFTVQNEPEASQQSNSPTCLVSAEQETRMIRELAPRLAAAGLEARPWLFDHNFSSVERVAACLADVRLRNLLGGVAWHPYSCRPEEIAGLRADYPDLPMYVTEMGPHVDKSLRDVLWWGDLVLSSFNNGCGAFTSWCLALDEDGQPNVSLGFPCAGFIEIHSETRAITESQQCRFFRHVSPFVRRGADVLRTRIVPGPAVAPGNELVDGIVHTAFRNPDGSHVVVFVCKGGLGGYGRIQIQVKVGGLYLPVQLFANAVATVVIP